jgi:pimeloyl-ACP methyl ester carboxylesterase
METNRPAFDCYSPQPFAPLGIAHKEGYVNLPGIRLRYVDYGGEGETLVALHGLVQNAHAFQAIAPLLVPHVRLIALDLRGRGGSDWGPADCYRWNFYLRDLRDFFDAMGLARFGLIGTSMGGTLAMLYTMAHPAEVTRLVLDDVVLNTNYAGVVRTAQRIGRAPPEFAGLAHALEWFLAERDGLDRLDEPTQRAWVSHFLVRGRGGGLCFNCDPVLIRRAGLLPPHLGPGMRWSHAKDRMGTDQAPHDAGACLARGKKRRRSPRERTVHGGCTARGEVGRSARRGAHANPLRTRGAGRVARLLRHPGCRRSFREPKSRDMSNKLIS